MRLVLLLPSLLLACANASFVAAQPVPQLTILPQKVELVGKEARQTLVLQWQIGGQAADPKFTSSDEKIVVVKDGIALAMGNGTATITGKSGAHTAAMEVKVTGVDQPFEWSFR